MATMDWTHLPEDHSLWKFARELPDILSDAEHSEMYGVTLEGPAEGFVIVVLNIL